LYRLDTQPAVLKHYYYRCIFITAKTLLLFLVFVLLAYFFKVRPQAVTKNILAVCVAESVAGHGCLDRCDYNNHSNEQETQLVLTLDKPCLAFRGQSRSPNMVTFCMLGMVSY